jgi:DNA-binding MarR family transcriptional regulator
MSPPQDRPDVQVFNEIGMIEHLIRQAVTRKLPAGMSYAQFELFTHFNRDGDGQTPAELAAAMQLTKGAITNTLQRMEAQGFVVVLADVSDRRKKRVRLTKAGMDAYMAVLKSAKPLIEALREGFTEAEFHAALPFLRALRAWLDEAVRSDEPEAWNLQRQL